MVESKTKKTYKKPSTLGWADWEDWNIETKNTFPWQYFFKETFPDFLRRFKRNLFSPFSNLRIYVYNRFVDGTHVLKTNLKIGKYYDPEQRMLHGLFSMLVDFVEIDLASQYGWDNPNYQKRKKQTLLWRRFKSRQMGLAHLDWASSLIMDQNMGVAPNDPKFGQLAGQALAAIEIKKLYLWWINRLENGQPNYYEISGYNKFLTEIREKYGISDEMSLLFGKGADLLSEEDKKIMTLILNNTRTLEENEKLVEDDMIVRLVKLRSDLWS